MSEHKEIFGTYNYKEGNVQSEGVAMVSKLGELIEAAILSLVVVGATSVWKGIHEVHYDMAIKQQHPLVAEFVAPLDTKTSFLKEDSEGL